MFNLVEGTATVLIADDARLRELNREFRGVDEATDVLTFPADPSERPYYGDIAISRDFAKRQAATRGVSVLNELQHLTIHGGLHLMGRDDQTPEEFQQMMDDMATVATSLGIETTPNWNSAPHVGGQA